MSDGYLVSRQTLDLIRRDHFELRTQIKNLRNTMRRISRTPGMREEQIIVKLSEDLDCIDTDSSPPQMKSAAGVVQVLKVDLNLDYGEVKNSAQSRKVVVFNATRTNFKTDEIVICQRNSLTGRFVIQGNGEKLVRFRLNQDPQAYKRPADTEVQYYYAEADSIEFAFDPANDDSTDNGLTLGATDTGDITVYDPWGRFRFAKGPRTHPDGSDLEGSYGYAELINGAYHMVECETVAKFILFGINNTAGYTQSDAVWNIHDTFTPLDGIHPGDIETVLNWRIDTSPITYLFEGVDGTAGVAQFMDDDLSSGSYYYRIIQLSIDCGTA